MGTSSTVMRKMRNEELVMTTILDLSLSPWVGNIPLETLVKSWSHPSELLRIKNSSHRIVLDPRKAIIFLKEESQWRKEVQEGEVIGIREGLGVHGPGRGWCWGRWACHQQRWTTWRQIRSFPPSFSFFIALMDNNNNNRKYFTEFGEDTKIIYKKHSPQCLEYSEPSINNYLFIRT